MSIFTTYKIVGSFEKFFSETDWVVGAWKFGLRNNLELSYIFLFTITFVIRKKGFYSCVACHSSLEGLESSEPSSLRGFFATLKIFYVSRYVLFWLQLSVYIALTTCLRTRLQSKVWVLPCHPNYIHQTSIYTRNEISIRFFCAPPFFFCCVAMYV